MIFGGVGDDVLSSGGGHDVMTGNAGADIVRWDFQIIGIGMSSSFFEAIDHTESLVTDFESGTDRLAITSLFWGDEPFDDTIDGHSFGFASLDTNSDGLIDGLDDYTAVADGNLVLDLTALWQNERGNAAPGVIELQAITSLTPADVIA